MSTGFLNLGVNVLGKLQNHFVERYSKYFNLTACQHDIFQGIK